MLSCSSRTKHAMMLDLTESVLAWINFFKERWTTLYSTGARNGTPHVSATFTELLGPNAKKILLNR